MNLPNLKKARERKQISQAKLADMMCLSVRTISFWENGGSATDNNAKRLAITLGVNPKDLI